MKSLVILLVLTSLSAWADVVPGVTDVRNIVVNGTTVELLTDIKGLSLYTFDPDGGEESTCYDACARAWPPIILKADQVELVEAPFHVTTRRDGKIQLTFNAQPLYLYVGDRVPGDIKGDGLGGVWHLAIDEE